VAVDKNRCKDRIAVIADDHAIVRQATMQILGEIPGLQIVAEAANGLEAIAAIKKHKPDLLVLDAAMPLARGIEVFAEVRRWSPDTRVMLVTGFTSASLLADWLNAGVDGMMLKSAPTAEMRLGFEAVLEGAGFISEEVRTILDNSTAPSALSDREREVLALIATGHSNSDISDKLCISIKTVEKHRASLMSKVGVHSVAELMVYALREGLLDEHKQL